MLTRSMEDYLEAVLILGRTGRRVRIVDVARFLGVRMPSVTGMVKTLVSSGYMEHSRYGDVRLTEKGREAAEQVLRRHKPAAHITITGYHLAHLVLTPCLQILLPNSHFVKEVNL